MTTDWSQLFFNLSPWLNLLALLGVFGGIAFCAHQNLVNRRLKKQLDELQNEFRAMNSGHLGMGREIRRVMKEVAHVEELKQQSNDIRHDKAYEQASLLLSRGATIEEVVESCNITPAEAELIAVMRHSAPSHTRRASRVA